MAGKRSRSKGQRGEREFFQKLNSYLPEHLHMTRTLNQTRDGGSDGSDELFGVEIKRQEALKIGTWLKQARRQCEDDSGELCKTPVLAYRQNNADWSVLVEMDTFQFARYLEWRHKLEAEAQRFSVSPPD